MFLVDKMGKVKKICLVYIHGFLGEKSSRLGDELERISQERNCDFVYFSWRGGNPEELSTRVFPWWKVLFTQQPARAVMNISFSAMETAANTLSRWHRTIEETENAAFALNERLEQLLHTNNSIALVGFSLGTRVICEALALFNQKILENIHTITFCGAAISSAYIPPLKKLQALQPGFKITNFYSQEDDVLKMLYPLGNYGASAAGHIGFQDTTYAKNVLLEVGHGSYSSVAETIYACTMSGITK